jgi:hypothetical protein
MSRTYPSPLLDASVHALLELLKADTPETRQEVKRVLELQEQERVKGQVRQ